MVSVTTLSYALHVCLKVRLDIEINFTVMFGLSVRRGRHVSIVRVGRSGAD